MCPVLRTPFALMIALIAGCASASSQSPAPDIYSFDCDVPPAKFSEWTRSVSSQSLEVSGTVQLIEPRQDQRWWPGASIFLYGDNSSEVIGLQLAVQRQAPDEAHVLIINQEAQPAELASLPWRGNPLPFKIKLSRSGEFSVTVADKSRSVRVDGFRLAKMSLSCSTGQFKFTNVTVGAGR
jgi:hypothetical protein